MRSNSRYQLMRTLSIMDLDIPASHYYILPRCCPPTIVYRELFFVLFLYIAARSLEHQSLKREHDYL